MQERVILTLSHLSGHTSLKYHVKSDTNIIDSFSVAVKLIIYPFSHMVVVRYKGYARDFPPNHWLHLVYVVPPRVTLELGDESTRVGL